MRPKTITVTGVGNSNTIPIDWREANFQLSLGCVVSGTVNYTIQHTFDDVLAGATPTWFNHSFLQSQTANADGNYAFPITALRVVVNSGTGSVAVRIVQSTTAY